MVPGGISVYTLLSGSGRTDGRSVYGVIRCVPILVVFGVGTQLGRWPVMTHCPKARAGGGSYLFSSRFVHVRVG